MEEGYIQLGRSRDTWELVSNDHLAFILLSVIALRARRNTKDSILGIKQGEALIGDYKKYGLTEQQYRNRKLKLEKWGFATFKSTNKGTIAKLVDKTIYNINEEINNGQNNTRATDKQRTSNGQATTNKNDNKEIKKKNERIEISEEVLKSDEYIVAQKWHALEEAMFPELPAQHTPQERYVAVYKLMHRKDKPQTKENIMRALKYSYTHSKYWKGKISSPKKFLENYVELMRQANSENFT